MLSSAVSIVESSGGKKLGKYLSIRLRIVGVFLMLVLMLASIAVISSLALDNVIDRSDKADDANRLVKYTLDLRLLEKEYILEAVNPVKLDKIRGILHKINRQIGETSLQFTDPENDRMIDDLSHIVSQYSRWFEKFVVADEKFRRVFKDLDYASSRLEDSLYSFMSLQKSQLKGAISVSEADGAIDEYNELNAVENIYALLQKIKAKATIGSRILPETLGAIQALERSLDAEVSSLVDMIEGDESQALLEKVRAHLHQFKGVLSKYYDVLDSRTSIIRKLDSFAETMEGVANVLRQDQKRELVSDMLKSQGYIYYGSALVIFLSVVFGWALVSGITRGLDGLIGVISLLNRGQRIHQEDLKGVPKGELLEIGQVLVDMDHSIRAVSLSMEQQKHLLDHLGMMRLVLGDTGEVTHVSEPFCQVMGGNKETVQKLLSNQLDFIVFEKLIKNLFMVNVEWDLKNIRGEYISFLFDGVVLDARHILLIGRVASSSMESATVIGQKPNALAIVDEAGHFVLANAPFRALMDIQGKVLTELTSLEISQQQYCNLRLDNEMLRKLSDSGDPIEIVINPNRLEKKRYAYLRVISFPENRLGVLFALALTDISHIRLSEERIRHLAYYDTLTSLPNRAHLMEEVGKRISLAKRKNARFALLFIDLDEFKSINDSLGHVAGDDLLKKLSMRLINLKREGEFLGRLGGDEFCLLTDWIENDGDPGFLAERLIGVIREDVSFTNDNVTAKLSCSIGISIFPQDGDSTIMLLQAADSAMYAAKRAGKNCFRYYNAEMTQEAKICLRLSQELREALKKDEFILHWQPIIDIKNSKVGCLEALVRWNHPRRGLIYPDQFIPAVERFGLTSELGSWVIKKSCEQWAEWNKIYSDNVSIAVNISAKHFESVGFVDQVRDCVDYFNIPEGVLEIEITESMTRDIGSHIDICNQLSELGVNVSVDDFGTGYSSLSVLTQLGVDWLKIDRQFVDQILVDHRHYEIVVAIIHMANAINVGVISEGVETADQAQALIDLGCSYLQGYFFSKPVPAEEVRRFIDSHLPAHLENLSLGHL